MSSQEVHSTASKVLQDAWQNKDLTLLSTHLAKDIEWYEAAREEPITSDHAVIEQWDKDLAEQSDIQVTVELLDWVENRGYHHCVARWKDKASISHKVDGIFVIKLNPIGEIIYFKPWYDSMQGM